MPVNDILYTRTLISLKQNNVDIVTDPYLYCKFYIEKLFMI